MSVSRVQCPECGFGDYEVGYLTDGAEAYCIICQEEDGRTVRLHRRDDDETVQARFRLADAA
jgi:hypothetical protein